MAGDCYLDCEESAIEKASRSQETPHEGTIENWTISTSKILPCTSAREHHLRLGSNLEHILKDDSFSNKQSFQPTPPQCSPPRQYSSSPSFPSRSRKIHKLPTGLSYLSHPSSHHVPRIAVLSGMSKANVPLPTFQPLTRIVSVPIHDLHPSMTPVQLVCHRSVSELGRVRPRQTYRRSRRGTMATVLRTRGLVPRLEVHRHPHLPVAPKRKAPVIFGKCVPSPELNIANGRLRLSTHYKWVIMLVVVIVAIVGGWIAACMLRRRYIRKKEKEIEMRPPVAWGPHQLQHATGGYSEGVADPSKGKNAVYNKEAVAAVTPSNGKRESKGWLSKKNRN